jgi:hypothetical protein
MEAFGARAIFSYVLVFIVLVNNWVLAEAGCCEEVCFTSWSNVLYPARSCLGSLVFAGILQAQTALLACARQRGAYSPPKIEP